MHLRNARYKYGSQQLAALALLCALVLLNGCLANNPVPTPEPQPWQREAGPEGREETLGERLGRLDAHMQSTTPDSMPLLQREYDSLLALAAGPGGDTSLLAERIARQGGYRQEQITTGPPPSGDTYPGTSITADPDSGSTGTDIASDNNPDGSYTSTPRRSADIADSELPGDNSTLAEDPYTSTRRRSAGNSGTKVVTSKPADPRRFKGLRENEKATIPGYRAAASSKTRSRRTAATAASRRNARAVTTRRSNVATASPRRTESSNSMSPTSGKTRTAAERKTASSQREIVEGIAAERAGKYSEATRRLGGIKGGLKTPSARYSYALSLEKTGELSRAASEYLALSGSGTALGHKAYIGYCRVLSMSGQRSRARELVQRFIRQNPASGQVGSARRLLQTL